MTEEHLRRLRYEDDAVDRADAIMVESAEHRVRVGNKAALAALEQLANWKPECGFPRNITRAHGRDGTPRRELQDALEQVSPEQVHLFAINPGDERLDAFLKRLAGLVKHT